MIRFSHVTKTWPNGATALRDLSFHVPKGQFVFLTGHSGAGKSSILSLISAHERPTEGDVKVANISLRTLKQSEVPKLRRRLGIVFQDFRLLDDRTTDENVAFALEATGAPAAAIPGRVMRVLTQVGLASKARSYPRELSGGEQQRVAIARALVNDPPILLADEPTGNLDERASRSVFQLIRDINASGTSVIMATHNLELVRDTHYRTLELKQGQLVYDSAEERVEEIAPSRLVTREAFRAFRRAPALSALAVAAIGFSLFTTGLYALVALNFRSALEGIAERVEIVAFLMRGTPAETVTLASQDIAAFPEVLEVSYVSEEEALKRAQRELEEFREAYKELSTNPLPASFEIRLKPPYRSATAARAVADRLAGFPFVDDVRYGREWIERLDQLRRLASIVGFAIGLAFAIVAVAIIGVTIRITVFQRAREISIMRLVGATNSFIRGPFVLEGAIKGVLGGFLALLLCWGGFALFRAAIGAGLPDLKFFRPLDMIVIVLFGTLIGLLGSLLSVGRHLKAV